MGIRALSLVQLSQVTALVNQKYEPTWRSGLANPRIVNIRWFSKKITQIVYESLAKK